MCEKHQQMIYIEKGILSEIYNDIGKLGHGIKLSGWISQACKEKLDNKFHVQSIINKLKQWNESFPKKPFKELIKEIEDNYNEKV